MPIGDMEVELSLATVCQGKLEEAFQDLYPKIVAAMKQGDKAGLAINIGLEKMKDSDLMFALSYSISPKFPSRSRASICQVTNDYTLKTDKPVPRAEVVSLFDKKEAK